MTKAPSLNYLFINEKLFLLKLFSKIVFKICPLSFWNFDDFFYILNLQLLGTFYITNYLMSIVKYHLYFACLFILLQWKQIDDFYSFYWTKIFCQWFSIYWGYVESMIIASLQSFHQTSYLLFNSISCTLISINLNVLFEPDQSAKITKIYFISI